MPFSEANRITFLTPAKINTYLFIQGKRTDGYHELLMDLIPVSYYDSIELEQTDNECVELLSNLSGVAKEDNLVVKAVRLLEAETKKQFSLNIKLNKKIPSGAGLGGGSGNAAGMLIVLNKWYQLNLPDYKLKDLALKLGADVPFFIDPRPSLAKGMGEDLSALPHFEPLNLLLINPGFPISTGRAYANCQISGRKKIVEDYTPDFFSTQEADINDFWLPLEKEFPELSKCRQSLISEGAVFGGLSGSGSTVFGIFDNPERCNSAYSKLSLNKNWSVIQCKTLQCHNYLNTG